jgi:hypothetical protein
MNVKIIAVFLLMLSGCMTQRDIKPEVSRPIITICSGCGSEWRSYGPGDVKPITKCPNCPMTPEEFEALKEQVRKQKSKGVEND